jgi:hypothetical protein
MMSNSKYQKYFSDAGFWRKVGTITKEAGIKVVYSGLLLY